MDIGSIIAPTITDFDLLEEFAESLHDATPVIERDMARLKQAPDARHIVADLFRTLHNIKGDAAVCKIELAIAIAHPIETVLARLRGGEIAFNDVLAEAILLAVDRLELAVENLCAHRSLENLRLPALIQGLESLAAASGSEVETVAGDLIEAVTDFRPVADSTAGFGRDPAEEDSIERSPAPSIGETLLFFRSLAEQFESHSPPFKGRTQRLLRLAVETNQIRGQVVDPIQLEAAVYMHDIGMMFLPESIWLKAGQITPEERAMLRKHPGYTVGLLSRMPGWEGAAEMVAQHHEMPDGGGYPKGLTAATICDGAKILAIVDAFESVMLKHASRGKGRSLLRAIAEINACENQFAPEWIAPFNQVIHRSINP
ncbi:MAG: HD domain-containing protein [Candidatus Accumulibacter sp.]|jgi:HD-GYP domain-containing protein (c-di-GMP phosphodiesterase class II)|nr:HD domain-containing protein [Accumulibacter sp.]